MSEYSFTIFKSIFDNKTDRQMSFSSLERFEKILYDLSQKPGYKPKRGEVPTQEASPLFSPAVYAPNTTRKNASVLHWGRWAALDIDKYDCTFKEALQPFLRNYCIVYSSASSTVEFTKFRVIFPLSDIVPAEKIRHFWFALNTEFNSIGDKQTKDLSRMYYVPAQYPNANNFIFTSKKGPLIDPSALMMKHAYVDGFKKSLEEGLSDEVKNQLSQWRKDKLTESNVKWTSYRDCPFVNKNLIAEYRAITGEGWYRKMFSIMLSIAVNAINKKYPITAEQIAQLAREFDRDNGNWYQNRAIDTESRRALDFALKNTLSSKA